MRDDLAQRAQEEIGILMATEQCVAEWPVADDDGAARGAELAEFWNVHPAAYLDCPDCSHGSGWPLARSHSP